MHRALPPVLPHADSDSEPNPCPRPYYHHDIRGVPKIRKHPSLRQPCSKNVGPRSTNATASTWKAEDSQTAVTLRDRRKSRTKYPPPTHRLCGCVGGAGYGVRECGGMRDGVHAYVGMGGAVMRGMCVWEGGSRHEMQERIASGGRRRILASWDYGGFGLPTQSLTETLLYTEQCCWTRVIMNPNSGRLRCHTSGTLGKK